MDHPHEHSHAISWEETLKVSQDVCERRGVRLTPLREKVLHLIWQAKKPAGAYELLDRLKVDKKKAAPPTIYRALEFLLEQGLIHRIDSMNAFVACSKAHYKHLGHFLICECCGTVIEVDDKRVNGLIYQGANHKGFKPKKQVLEVHGVCETCT